MDISCFCGISCILLLYSKGYVEQSKAAWFGEGEFGNGQIEGYPAFIQADYNARGNFECCAAQGRQSGFCTTARRVHQAVVN
jgi:hypothetical protein